MSDSNPLSESDAESDAESYAGRLLDRELRLDWEREERRGCVNLTDTDRLRGKPPGKKRDGSWLNADNERKNRDNDRVCGPYPSY